MLALIESVIRLTGRSDHIICHDLEFTMGTGNCTNRPR